MTKVGDENASRMLLNSLSGRQNIITNDIIEIKEEEAAPVKVKKEVK